jgi:hypothetical protein
MSLLALFFVIVVIGVVVYCIRRWAPMDQAFKDIVLWVGVGVVVLLLLHAFGVLDAIRGVQVPRL